MDSGPPVAWTQRVPPTPAAARTSWTWTLARPAELTAARTRLRSLTAETMPDGAVEDDVDRVLLAFEELASNGLRHGGPPVHVRVVATDHGWLIDVTDGRIDRSPVPAVDRDPAFGGLGLHLIARLSAAVGWAVVGPRKHVWACLVPAA